MILSILQLSIAEIFSDNAELSGFSECDAKLHVNKIIQKVYFGIDEIGTLGTKGGFHRGGEFLRYFEINYIFLEINYIFISGTQRRGVQPKNPHIVVDHPFVFFVRHRASNTIIFSGHIRNPAKSLKE